MSNPSFINFLLAFFLIYNSASCQTKKTKEINTCIVSKSVNNYYSTIKGDSLVYLIAKSSDECNLKLVDSLIENFIRNGGKQDYEMLQNLSNLSDGYLSEYFVEKISKIYNKKFVLFFDYLYSSHTKKVKNNLENFLIESWSSTASLSDNTEKEIKNIKSKTIKAVTASKGNKDKLVYLATLLNKINPNYLD